VALNKRSTVLGDVHDLLTAISRHVAPQPAGVAEALDRLRAFYGASRATIDVEAVVRDATVPVRRESGFQFRGLSDLEEPSPPPPVEAVFPCLSKLETPGGDFTIGVANRVLQRWEILPGAIERRVLDHLLQADGVPAFGHQIPELRTHPHRVMPIVWKINVSASLGLGDGMPLVESMFSSVRRCGAKSDPLHDRVFFVRRYLWPISEIVRVPRLDRAVDVLTERFGTPPMRDPRS
jgi:hypothetical protein